MKWECPVCKQKGQKEDVCSNCGFDRTLDLERYSVITELSREKQKIFLENYNNSRKIAKEKGGVLWEKLEEQQDEIKRLRGEVKEKENEIIELKKKLEKDDSNDSNVPIEPPAKKNNFLIIALSAIFFACGGAAGGYWGISRVTQVEKNDTRNDQNLDHVIESATESLARESVAEAVTEKVTESAAESATEKTTKEQETTIAATKESNTNVLSIEKLSTEAENGKSVYCKAQIIAVGADDGTVTLNGEPVELSADGTFVVEPAKEIQTITAVDKAGNTTSVDIVVNEDHIFDDDGICKVCGKKENEEISEDE